MTLGKRGLVTLPFWGGETGISQAHSGVFIEPPGAHVLGQTASFSISLCFLINHFLGGKREAIYTHHMLPFLCAPLLLQER